MALRHEVNFSCPDTDNPAIHHAPIAVWDVAEATTMAEALAVPCFGFRFSTWDEKGALVSVSPYYVFGRAGKTAAELRASPDRKERTLADAAERDGMARVPVTDKLTICLRPGDVVLPALNKREDRDGLATR